MTTPADGPAPAAGERYVVVQPEGSHAVYADDADGHPHLVGYCGEAADARLLAYGRADLARLAAALERLEAAAELYMANQDRATDQRCGLVQPVTVAEAIELNTAVLVARAALAAAGGGAGEGA